MSEQRILYAPLRDRRVSAKAAAALIKPDQTVATSSFIGSCYPKAAPMAITKRIEAANLQGKQWPICVCSRPISTRASRSTIECPRAIAMHWNTRWHAPITLAIARTSRIR
ncbi:hypothetical protein [Xanthomonas arboricola]|uniref:hypothetical protein n=1 Tax=Xanthomonas arboricola TaxID=56448 RepID=UPI001290777C|nr:hypothetical protein [Xanthomonas arboricola]